MVWLEKVSFLNSMYFMMNWNKNKVLSVVLKRINPGRINPMNRLKLNKLDKTHFIGKAYNNLKKSVIFIYALFMMIYVFRDNLYEMNNQYITLLAWTAPNLIPSFLFTIMGIFYIAPMLFKSADIINNSKLIWIVNAVNIVIFGLIEYVHVIFKIGVWDNKDIIASIIGIIFATFAYFQLRKFFR